MDVVKKVYDDVGNMLGYYPASDTPFILYSMSDFKGYSTSRSMSADFMMEYQDTITGGH
jgi:hypothetical protein